MSDLLLTEFNKGRLYCRLRKKIPESIREKRQISKLNLLRKDILFLDTEIIRLQNKRKDVVEYYEKILTMPMIRGSNIA